MRSPVASRRGDIYLIDRPLQSSGHSFTGLKGLGIQDCAMQESMGPVADRTKEHLLTCDAAIVRLRRLLLAENLVLTVLGAGAGLVIA